MLKGNDERAVASGAGRSRLVKARSITWLGQTAASVCWISSMLSYGIESPGDWLQLCAASAWLLANIAAFVTAERPTDTSVVLQRGRGASSSSAVNSVGRV